MKEFTVKGLDTLISCEINSEKEKFYNNCKLTTMTKMVAQALKKGKIKEEKKYFTPLGDFDLIIVTPSNYLHLGKEAKIYLPENLVCDEMKNGGYRRLYCGSKDLLESERSLQRESFSYF